jgi:hypothetical protein
MLENTDEVLKSFGDDIEQVRPMHSLYGKLVDSQSRVIVMLLRALNVNNDVQWIDAVDQSTKVLKNVGDSEALFSGALLLTRENWKLVKDRIRCLDLEMEQLKEREQERREKKEKDRKRGKLFDALLRMRIVH